MWSVCNADLYSEDDREIEVMEPVRVLNLFTIMNRGGAETMVMNYYRKINKRSRWKNLSYAANVSSKLFFV